MAPLFQINRSSFLLLLLSFLLLTGRQVSAKVEYVADELKMKNSEQMDAIVQKKIQKANDLQSEQKSDDDSEGITADPAAVSALRDALRIALSRPDQDGTRSILFTRLRRELSDLSSFEAVLKDLTKEALANLHEKDGAPRVQATYVVLLENLMAEMKPEVDSNTTFKNLIVQIRDSNIKLSDKFRAAERLRDMTALTSPSETAAQILPKAAKK